MKSEMERIHHTLSTLATRVQALEDNLDASDLKQCAQDREIQEIKKSLHCVNAVADTKTLLDDMCRETEDRWRRRKHLIVTGIEEHSGSIEERKEKDIEKLSELFEEIGVDVFSPQEVSRVGRIDSTKPRPIRFKCRDTELRAQILRNSRKLKNSTRFRYTFINPDLTFSQRKMNSELRLELKMRKENGENVTIRRGKVIDLNKSPYQNFQ